MKILNKRTLLIISPLLIIMIISFLNMVNAPLLDSTYDNNLIKQIIWYIVGFIIIIVIQKLNLKNILKYSYMFYIVSCLLLVLVLFLGKEVNGARAWFKIGSFSFQPSELMKLSLALYLADIVSKAKTKSFREELILILKVLILTLVPSVLVFLEPDTGAILFYFLIAISLLFISGIRKRWFILLFSIVILLVGLFIILYIYNQDLLIDMIGTSFFYRVERLITFRTNSSYQLENALITIGASSLFGVGLNNISLYIPEAPTDFIFAFTIGNFGIITGLIVLICYLVMDILLINEYYRCNDKKIKLFLFSFISIFFFQQVINIGMNLGMVPIIGIPLPFLSYGGSTIIIYFIFLGIIFNNIIKDKDKLI